MSPARAKLLNVGRFACLAAALAIAALSLASNWWWLKAWGTIAPWRASMGIDRGCAYIYLSNGWPVRIDTASWAMRAIPNPYAGYQWWGWFWPWRPLTTPGGWFCQFGFPSWLPFAILGSVSAVLWRTLSRSLNALTTGCATCNYDRRGLPTIAPCPECGAAPASK